MFEIQLFSATSQNWAKRNVNYVITVGPIVLKFGVWHLRTCTILIIKDFFKLFEIWKLCHLAGAFWHINGGLTAKRTTRTRTASSRRKKWRWFRVSIIIRSEVMAKKVFLTFLVTLTLTLTRFSTKKNGFQRLPVPTSMWNFKGRHTKLRPLEC